jgi:membrane protease YdiL (CAAX protease family)
VDQSVEEDEADHAMRSSVVVVACVIVSVLWLALFSVAAHYFVMMPMLAAGGSAVVVGVLAWLPPVRARLAFRARDFFWGVAVGGASVAATYLCYPIIRALIPGIADDVSSIYRLMPATWFSFPVVLLVVCAEELLWRGALLDALRADHPVASAIVLSTTLYATAQLGLGVPALAVVAFGLGILWSIEAILTGRLIAGLVSHAIWSVTVFGVFPLEQP